MNTALAILVFLAASHDKDYVDDNENESKNKNKPVDHNVDRPPAVAE
jgi:hypothetical protein